MEYILHSMESIPHSMEFIPHIMESIPHSMESILKMYGVSHSMEKVWSPSPIPWIPSEISGVHPPFHGFHMDYPGEGKVQHISKVECWISNGDSIFDGPFNGVFHRFDVDCSMESIWNNTWICDINFSDIPWILYGPVHQSKILVWNEVLCHETFSLWQHSLFIPLGSPNSLEPSPAAVTLGQWSAWVSNLANDLPAVSSQHLIIFSVRYRTAGL